MAGVGRTTEAGGTAESRVEKPVGGCAEVDGAAADAWPTGAHVPAEESDVAAGGWLRTGDSHGAGNPTPDVSRAGGTGTDPGGDPPGARQGTADESGSKFAPGESCINSHTTAGEDGSV